MLVHQCSNTCKTLQRNRCNQCTLIELIVVIWCNFITKPECALLQSQHGRAICYFLIWISCFNSLRPGDAYMRQQTNHHWFRTNAGILLIGTLGTNFSEILSAIHTFPFTKMHLKMSSGRWRPFCLGINVSIKFRFREGTSRISQRPRSVLIP